VRAARERVLLISDRVDLQPPPHDHEPEGPNLRADGVIVGSRLTLDRAVRNVQAYSGMSLLEAVSACTLRPARLLGVEGQRGTLRPGARADFALLDDAGRVVETWMEGKAVHALA